ncbi:MAG TPA: hypothetical protein O0X59_02120 [Methanocorpusculum sp.]|nr:hypothetical protein [Methanocorpusculum sp.]
MSVCYDTAILGFGITMSQFGSAECLRECLFATDVLVAAALFVTYGCFSLIPQRKRLSACTGRTVLNRR